MKVARPGSELGGKRTAGKSERQCHIWEKASESPESAIYMTVEQASIATRLTDEI